MQPNSRARRSPHQSGPLQSKRSPLSLLRSTRLLAGGSRSLEDAAFDSKLLFESCIRQGDIGFCDAPHVLELAISPMQPTHLHSKQGVVKREPVTHTHTAA